VTPIVVRVTPLPVSFLRLAVVLVLLVPAAVAVAAPGVEISPADSLEASVLTELNAVRAANELKPLRLNAKLTAAANQHSKEMLRAGYFGHESADGGAFWKRIKRFYTPVDRKWMVGENLLWQTPTVSAKQAVRAWLESPEHRDNLLKPEYRDVGLAAVRAISAPGVYGYRRVLVLTADFGSR
jgi:uncharacterized protein YkwD